jgi:hypothetical protein
MLSVSIVISVMDRLGKNRGGTSATPVWVGSGEKRTTLACTMRSFVLRLLVLPALLAACQAVPSRSESTTPPKLEQWSGAHGAPSPFAVRALRDPAAWDGFWQQMGRVAPRSLDATREMAVAIMLGRRKSGGYSAEIVRVQPRDGNLVVEYREHVPPPDMMVTQALTQPWAVAIVPRSDLPLTAQKIEAAAK